jgi:F0F1-type ATP synthase membrane subunit b/b'
MTLIQAGQYAGALIAIFTLLGMFIKWVVVKPIKSYIDTATAQIAPNANGGRSLNDLVTKVDDLKTMLNKHLQEHDTPK